MANKFEDLRKPAEAAGRVIAAGAVATGGGAVLDAAFNNGAIVRSIGSDPRFNAQAALDQLFQVKTAEAQAGYPQVEAPRLSDEVVGALVRVPTKKSEIQVSALRNAKEGEYVHPIYDEFTANQENNWRGIGPHFPIAFNNIDAGAGHLEAESVGILRLVTDGGGRIQFSIFQQWDTQNDSKWGTVDGKQVQNPNWKNIYVISQLAPNQAIDLIDPDTGKKHFWEDGSPIGYTANDRGIAAFEIPDGDVRVGFEICLPPNEAGVQNSEVLIRRGVNNRPELRGENPLPRGTVKTYIPYK